MNFIRNLLALAIMVRTILADDRDCPTNITIKLPCVFSKSEYGCDIVCKGEQAFDYKSIFDELSAKLPANQKNFETHILNNKAIEELPANAFADIKFNTIEISGGILQRIHPDAFAGTANTISELRLYTSPVSQRLTNTSDLFGAIKTLQSLQTLRLYETNITTLPSMALSGLKKLTLIELFGPSTIAIEKHAFNDLPYLKMIYIDSAKMEKIADEAFTVGNKSAPGQRLIIQLNIPPRLGLYTEHTLDSIGCQTSLIFINYAAMKHLDRKIYEPFLSQNPLNTISDKGIDCADILNAWIHDMYPKVWTDLKCK